MQRLVLSRYVETQRPRPENHENSSTERPVPSQFNGDCLADQVNRSDDGRAWSVGSMVWTLFDYYGEPYHHTWPHVASSYGSFDLAGFPKAAVWWYHLRNISMAAEILAWLRFTYRRRSAGTGSVTELPGPEF
jgi:hypothetical protein